jgi:FKBP12-rapamycin complex-associated protein
LYYHVFRRIDKQLPSLTTLDLHSVSPELLKCRKLELAVPGTYAADSPVVTIEYFVPQLIVITSKQRPRKLTIHGSDGNDYAFLLKGHEDLRQDERVMQLFGLVNTLLENSRKTSEKDLSIQRYAVIPLSPNSGLIGWVPNCDTLHALIREYRDARKIFLNQEHRLMLAFAPDYDHLPLIAKVEVFQHALQNTEGNDLAKVLWLKSRTSEVWLERRTNYTRSLAVMSMVGYLLGLGDRHPSNLMLDRYSGKILHIDFGDCFEASMNREKFPEKVPFRLTRMLVKAMEVSGIEGTFRTTCENVMQVLRTNRDSVMAMMEAFVHDPLINWRLFNFNEVPQVSNYGNAHAHAVVSSEEAAANRELMQPQRGAREKELLQAVNQLGDANEVLNERAVAVMARMSHKLTGRDFSSGSASGAGSSTQHGSEHWASGDARDAEPGLSVKVQVQKLILQAQSHENLCQNYVGWCPFW